MGDSSDILDLKIRMNNLEKRIKLLESKVNVE